MSVSIRLVLIPRGEARQARHGAGALRVLLVPWRQKQLKLSAVYLDVLPVAGREADHRSRCGGIFGGEAIPKMHRPRAYEIERQLMNLRIVADQQEGAGGRRRAL